MKYPTSPELRIDHVYTTLLFIYIYIYIYSFVSTWRCRIQFYNVPHSLTVQLYLNRFVRCNRMGAVHYRRFVNFVLTIL